MAFQPQRRMHRLTRRSDGFLEGNLNGFTHTRGLCCWHFSIFLPVSFAHSDVINVERVDGNKMRHTTFTRIVLLIAHFTFPLKL